MSKRVLVPSVERNPRYREFESWRQKVRLAEAAGDFRSKQAPRPQVDKALRSTDALIVFMRNRRDSEKERAKQLMMLANNGA